MSFAPRRPDEPPLHRWESGPAFLAPVPTLGWLAAAALAVGPGWHFGGVGVVGWSLVVALAAVAVSLVAGRRSGMPSLRTPWLAAAPLAIAALGAAQLLPLPSAVRARLSPGADAEWRELSAQLPTADLPEVFPGLSLHPTGTRGHLTLAALSAACLFVGAQFLRGTGALRWWFAALGLMGSATALVGVTYMSKSPHYVYGTVPLSEGGQPFAGFVTRNHAGALLNMCFAGALAWCLRSWSRSRAGMHEDGWERLPSAGLVSRQSPDGLVAGLALAFTGLGVAACLSRGAWVGAAAGSAAAMLTHLVSRRRAVVSGSGSRRSAYAPFVAAIGVVTVIGALALLAGLDDRISQRLSGGKEARWKHWRDLKPADVPQLFHELQFIFTLPSLPGG